ncbi:MAG: pirin family protein [Mariprofundus sp.]|nr:pirin family protein [Mariprofundus sp.]
MSITIYPAISVPEGDGIIVKRLMPVHGLHSYDPFVLLDHFDISGGGFPDHPHRGFEAITYLFDGGMNHTDNLGNKGIVHAGGAQRFTAGRGMVHSEFPDGSAHGIQLWINLPKRLKSIAPAYQQLQADMIPEVHHDGVTIRTIVGEDGAISLHTDAEYLDLQLRPESRFERKIAAGARGLVYVVDGSIEINGLTLESGQAACMDDIAITNIISANESRLMWCFGSPHNEPIHQHGPFVD